VNALTVVLVGHLTRAMLDEKFAPVERQLARDKSARYGLLVDIVGMTGYDNDARSQYIAWHNQHRDQLAVAVVTASTMWRMVISAVALAAHGQMRAFDSADAARSWLEGLREGARVKS
jgi:hypothetical protein